MPRIDMFGKSWRTGEDLAMDSAIRTLGGIGNMVNYWAKYSDQIKEEEAKKREKQEKLQDEFYQIKSLRNDLPDEIAWHIAQMSKGPYKKELISNVKKQPGFFDDINPLKPQTPLNKLINFYNQYGSLEPLNQMRAMILEGSQKSGRAPADIITNAVQEGLLDPGHAEFLFSSFGIETPREATSDFLIRKGVETVGRPLAGAVESIANIPSLVYDIGRAITPQSAQFDPTGELRESFTPQEYQRMQQAYETATPEQMARAQQEVKEKIPTPYLDVKSGLRNFFPEGYFAPAQTRGEQLYNDALDTTGALLLGGVRGANAAARAVRAFGAGAAGEVAKWASQKAGAHPLVAEGLKLGSMLFTLHVGKKEAQQIASRIYNAVKGNPQAATELIPARQTTNLIDEINTLQKSGRYTPDTKTKNLLASFENKTLGTAETWSELNRSLFKDIGLQENRLARQQLQQPLIRLIDSLEKTGKKDISKIKSLINEINTNWNKLVYEGKPIPSQETAQLFGDIRRAQQLSLNDIVNLEQTLNNSYSSADSLDRKAIGEIKKGSLQNMFNYIKNSSPEASALVEDVNKARQIYASSQEVGKVSKIIDKVMGEPTVGRYVLYGLMGGNITRGAQIALGTYGVRQTVGALEQFMKNLSNPELRRVLGNTVINALRGKAVQSGKELKRIFEEEQDKKLNKLIKRR